MNYWLVKTEPDEYSIDDLEQQGVTPWDGIRNYQARNFLRDEVKEGDQVFIYHSSCAKPGVVGAGEVVKAAYPDPAQFDSESSYFDAKATVEKPRWFCVDVAFVEKFSSVISLAELKQQAALKEMVLIKQGRLSVQPVKKEEWLIVMTLAKSD